MLSSILQSLNSMVAALAVSRVCTVPPDLERDSVNVHPLKVSEHPFE